MKHEKQKKKMYLGPNNVVSIIAAQPNPLRPFKFKHQQNLSMREIIS